MVARGSSQEFEDRVKEEMETSVPLGRVGTAVEGLTKAMAVELAPLGVRVNSLLPTFCDTPLTKPMFENEEFLNDTLSRIPLGRLGRIQDVMGAVVFLASPAAAIVAGASLLVDGGWTAQ